MNPWGWVFIAIFLFAASCAITYCVMTIGESDLTNDVEDDESWFT